MREKIAPMVTPTFFWHDYETTGTDPARDRPLQFAGIRTDAELNPVGEPVSLLCRPPRDSLPQPRACLVTGITPQRAEAEGVGEVEFAATVQACLGTPGTCGVGFNSLRFDDAFTRNLLYRNFHDPYEREWRNGNSRWDLIDLARLCHALRPEGIEWPRRDDGSPSFRLEHLAAANRLEQRRAHDALSDVEATLALARLLRQRQPRLWAWYLSLRAKSKAAALLDWLHMTPLLHVSSRYPAERRCMGMIAPLAPHPLRPNEVIVVELSAPPDALLQLDAEAIADRVFTPRLDLPEDV
ncbi:MAG TPA: exodeoxyribonuclease I, partial [Rhodanobacteraceae bacterium]|nr:exodeoxyribonuclease I [Rhodanobacteraceae bacterium]